MKKINVVKVYSRNNEIHFILREHKNNESGREDGDFSYAEVRTLMKKEAAKPMLLLRAE